jgi:hypothetical protein
MDSVENAAELKVRKMKFDNNIRRAALRRKL